MARTDGYKGGIQTGTIAADEKARKLDASLKKAFNVLREEFSSIKSKNKLSKEDKIKLLQFQYFGFAPDGGAWFLNDKLIAAFEAKKQGFGGNACERWYKNALVAKYLNDDVFYVTFMTGEGAENRGALWSTSELAKKILGGNFVFYLSPEGFSENEVIEIMRETLNKAMEMNQ